MGKVIGIDLGTTFSAVACLTEKGKPQIITDRHGNKTMPSIIAFGENGILTGQAASNKELTAPESVVKRIKRKMGTDYKFSYQGREYSPEELSSYIIKELKQQAEEYLHTKVNDAIITVPAYFNDNQRQATKTAGKLAGLNVLRIINEPTAASLSYGIEPGDDVNIIVYDLGGGTFDVSVLNVAEGVFEVIATAGDNNLGGEDFNKRIMDVLLSNFKKENGIDLSEDPLAMAKIYGAVEKAKIELSTQEKARIFLPFVTADEKGPKNIDFELNRSEFEELINDYAGRTIELCSQAVSDAGLKIKNIDKVIMVGGSSRIPLFHKKLEGLFGQKAEGVLNPEEVVACGAAIQGGIVGGDVSGVVLVDVTPLSMGIEVENGYFVPIIERNTPIPTSARRVFTTISDNQKNVDIHVMQGESMYSRNNISLGKFRLEGIRNALKGEPRIEVNFELDVNGILLVNAMDLDTKNTQQVTIVNENRMSDRELERIQKEYIEKFDQEIKKRDVLDTILKLKTKAESMITKLDHVLPPVYKKALLKNEIDEIQRTISQSVKELDPNKIERSIERLDFLMNESLAGSYHGDMTA